MDKVAPFSALALALFSAAAMAGELRRVGGRRPARPAEIRQAETLENLVMALRVALPQEGDYSAFLPLLRSLSEEAEAATLRGVAAPELLGMRGAIPRGPKWHPFPVTLNSLAWLGVVLIADALRAICHGAGATAQRQRQLAALLELQGALSAAIEVDPNSPRLAHVGGLLQAPYAAAAAAIGDQVPIIVAEAHAAGNQAKAEFLWGWIVPAEEPRQ